MGKKKILIIEDDKSLVNLIKDALDAEKYRVILALEAKEGSSKRLPKILI